MLLPTLLLAALLPAATAPDDEPNRIFNGDFEQQSGPPAAPLGWAIAGNRSVVQSLASDAGHDDGGHSARLECRRFEGDGPDAHAMLAQVGKVAVERGKWYRLSFWARARDLRAGSVEVSLVNTDGWVNSGLNEAFTPGAAWSRHDLLFQTKADVPAATSRLQFWFRSEGTLWLDDLTLTESSEGPQWYPQIAMDAARNAVPNSSFECGAAGWGSITYGLQGWAGNLYRLEASLDPSQAAHGATSLRIALDPRDAPTFWFDYYDPVRQPVRRVLAANRGWFRVTPGATYTLSASLRADVDPTVAQLAAIEPGDRWQRRDVRVGTSWTRQAFTFQARGPFLFIAAGLDLEASKREAGTLWIDAVQLESGPSATSYEPRQPVEAFLTTPAEGNIFDDPARGATVSLVACNATGSPSAAKGRITITDDTGAKIAAEDLSIDLAPGATARRDVARVNRNRLGAFRAHWSPSTPDAATRDPLPGEALRFAVIEPAPPGATDSPFGFNHAYPWDFLVRLAQRAGVVWWRDWSAKWQTVEPERGRFDFTVPDAQIGRVLASGGQVEVLLPFPSTRWSTTARPEEVAKAADSSYLRDRLPVAYAPKDLADFGRYAAEVVKRYRAATPRPVTHVQILNEPVYTNYALPRQFGYTLDDYLRLLETARDAIKAADPDCVVVGGPSANPSSSWTREFITKGGLKRLDVFDMHLYDPARPAESYEPFFRDFEGLVAQHGGPKPLWITEWGVYADDDPACIPQSVGDATMNRCRWPSERAATEHIVKFTAVSFAHGMRKLFFHAGTAGTINGPDAGGVLFEYGGEPRAMYAGVAALTRILGVPDDTVHILDTPTHHAYVFKTKTRHVAVAWTSAGHTYSLTLPPECQALDLMGNILPTPTVTLGESPIYLLSPDLAPILQTLDTTKAGP